MNHEIMYVYPISISSLIDVMNFTYYEIDTNKNERTYILTGQKENTGRKRETNSIR